MKLKVYHGTEKYDFEYGVVSVTILNHLFNIKYIPEVISF